MYSTDDIIERNETYEVGEYAPTLLMIGDDGGGRGILLERGIDLGPVYRIGLGSLAIEDADILADNLPAWFQAGLPLSA